MKSTASATKFAADIGRLEVQLCLPPPAPFFTHAYDTVPAIGFGEAFGEEEGTPLHFAAVELPER